MSYSSEEIYREKYQKYKKKYMIALQNMKGGLEKQPLTANSTIYLCTYETYERLQQSGRKDLLLNGSLLNNDDDCFIERLKSPYKSLMLKDNQLKIMVGKNGKDCKLPNYPFCRKFGIKEEFGADGLIKASSFDAKYAMMQLQDLEPTIKYFLEKENGQTLNGVFYLHTYGPNNKNVSYNHKLEYVPFPTSQEYINDKTVLNRDLLNQQKGGGGDASFYFCNPGATAAINNHYFKLSSTPAIDVDVKCLEDIALDTVLGDQQPLFGVLKDTKNEVYIHTTRTPKKDFLGRPVYTRISLEKIPSEGFGIGIATVTTTTKKMLNDDTIKAQIPIVKQSILSSLGTNEIKNITVFKLEYNKLSKVDEKANIVAAAPAIVAAKVANTPEQSLFDNDKNDENEDD